MIARFKPGKKKCKMCGELFEKSIHRAMQEVCSPDCAYKLVRKREDLKQKRKDTEEKKVMIENIKTYSDHLKDLEKVVNNICRLIDTFNPCVSCGGYGKPQAGHYHSVASDNAIRFNLHNIHIQDYRCNVELSSNIIGYDEGLLQLYGREYWEYVKFGIKNEYHEPIKLQVYEIKEMIFICREIIKELEQNKTLRSPEERIRLRNKYNLRIGIYARNFETRFKAV